MTEPSGATEGVKASDAGIGPLACGTGTAAPSGILVSGLIGNTGAFARAPCPAASIAAVFASNDMVMTGATGPTAVPTAAGIVVMLLVPSIVANGWLPVSAAKLAVFEALGPITPAAAISIRPLLRECVV
jgi:hypothetical protein